MTQTKTVRPIADNIQMLTCFFPEFEQYIFNEFSEKIEQEKAFVLEKLQVFLPKLEKIHLNKGLFFHFPTYETQTLTEDWLELLKTRLTTEKVKIQEALNEVETAMKWSRLLNNGHSLFHMVLGARLLEPTLVRFKQIGHYQKIDGDEIEQVKKRVKIAETATRHKKNKESLRKIRLKQLFANEIEEKLMLDFLVRNAFYEQENHMEKLKTLLEYEIQTIFSEAEERLLDYLEKHGAHCEETYQNNASKV